MLSDQILRSWSLGDPEGKKTPMIFCTNQMRASQDCFCDAMACCWKFADGYFALWCRDGLLFTIMYCISSTILGDCERSLCIGTSPLKNLHTLRCKKNTSKCQVMLARFIEHLWLYRKCTKGSWTSSMPLWSKTVSSPTTVLMGHAITMVINIY